MMFLLSFLVMVTGLQSLANSQLQNTLTTVHRLVTGLKSLETAQLPDTLTTDQRPKPDPECFMTPSQIAAKYGYRLDSHWVTTEDGYILEIHNIPKQGAPVVFLQHGLVDSSMTWMLNRKEGSFAFILSDNGFDVWMGNVRGNTFARNHTTLSVKSDEFWDFSFDEMNSIDLPNMVDYVLNKTVQRDLFYVGHSQGTEIGFTQFSRNVELSKKIKLFIALAPVARIDHAAGIFGYLSEFQRIIEWFLKEFHIKEFLPSNWFTKGFATMVCPEEPALCSEVLFVVGGYSHGNLDSSRNDIYISHTPAGTSVKNVIHWAQMKKAKKLQMFDFGSKKENMEHYGTPYPPEYNITGLKVPTVLVTGDNDYLADPTDELWLIQQIRQSVVKFIDLDNFNHMDFLWSMKAPTRVYYPVIDIMKSML